MKYIWKYPRPDFRRSGDWINLNGEWSFRSDENDMGDDKHWYNDSENWESVIQVPFPWESELSGVSQQNLEVGWYKKELIIPEEWIGERVLLNFGAVSYACSLWVNGCLIGTHEGGYFPFSFDITENLDSCRGVLSLRVQNPTNKLFIPHGKQKSIPPDDYDDCAFTTCSGIWQTVWLEHRLGTCISGFKATPSPTLDCFLLHVSLQGDYLATARLRVTSDGENPVEITVNGKADMLVEFPISEPKLWSPDFPNLYNMQLELISDIGIDLVSTYSGLRSIQWKDGKLFLNGKQLYIRGALDQGYWPESGYTHPGDEALKRDVELAIEAGFNLVRKHLKVEDPRWLFWADTLGLLVWEELPSTGRFAQSAISKFDKQIPEMFNRDCSHPSIIIWGLYNEEWGLDWKIRGSQERIKAVEGSYNILHSLDLTRPIVDNSGWSHVKTDLVDWHYYNDNISEWKRVTKGIAENDEFWFGHQLSSDCWYETQLNIPEAEHNNLPLLNGEYGGGFGGIQGWLFRWQTQDMRMYERFCGYIYTELFDVEHETIGIYDAYRKKKEFGFNPKLVNNETVICIDVVPECTEYDVLVQERMFNFPVYISHHGIENISGYLTWKYEHSPNIKKSELITVEPFILSKEVVIKSEVPANDFSHKLVISFISEMDVVITENILLIKNNNYLKMRM